MHCVQYGRLRSHFAARVRHAKQSSPAPPDRCLRFRFRGVAGEAAEGAFGLLAGTISDSIAFMKYASQHVSAVHCCSLCVHSRNRTVMLRVTGTSVCGFSVGTEVLNHRIIYDCQPLSVSLRRSTTGT